MDTRLHPDFLSSLGRRAEESELRQPNYWTQDPSSLITKCNIDTLVLGTGASLYHSIAPVLESTEHELILVTCFWARSTSLDVLRSCLSHLSDKGLKSGRKIRVRICLSSASLLQKLLHTQSLDGYVYPPTAWEGKLALPRPEDLGGLDLQVKSIFVKPFSVMHPKFMIVDRQKVLLPSCNVSWEDWFEGCIGMTGPVVEQFIRFWQKFWTKRYDADMLATKPVQDQATSTIVANDELALPAVLPIQTTDTPCIFLPSPHNLNPRFRLPWQDAASAPSTPLNVFLLAAFGKAERNLYIQTPNLTSPPVLSALLEAAQRGIDIHVVTSERLMVLEQLVTAGTTTSSCVKKLIRRYESKDTVNARSLDGIAEEGRAFMAGCLKIEYYEPTGKAISTQEFEQRFHAEPVQSHLKLTIIDEELVVLGSGNLDRASWYTSQELGVAFYSTELATSIRKTLDR
ncbi:hypothetical protein CAC42_4034 [Sphaceloma murrayae]|uniref:PLD phosphodiesterase domain-containing protein n=1 Tax=Sphaceloma murrayae TaxID=2082308 RepID=A0A2K1QSP7_9PEZI|nr:hypothetical protein CAC42_4034 [Sphaceloma murrayae]